MLGKHFSTCSRGLDATPITMIRLRSSVGSADVKRDFDIDDHVDSQQDSILHCHTSPRRHSSHLTTQQLANTWMYVELLELRPKVHMCFHKHFAIELGMQTATSHGKSHPVSCPASLPALQNHVIFVPSLYMRIRSIKDRSPRDASAHDQQDLPSIPSRSYSSHSDIPSALQQSAC